MKFTFIYHGVGIAIIENVLLGMTVERYLILWGGSKTECDGNETTVCERVLVLIFFPIDQGTVNCGRMHEMLYILV